MTKRIIIGPRANGDVGMFVSPVGVDADTAADSALLLSATSKVSQLILMSRVSSSTTIPLGLSRSPYVLITSQWDWTGVAGHTLGPGPFRPSPVAGGIASYVQINSNGASMFVSCVLPTLYEVYGQAFT